MKLFQILKESHPDEDVKPYAFTRGQDYVKYMYDKGETPRIDHNPYPEGSAEAYDWEAGAEEMAHNINVDDYENEESAPQAYPEDLFRQWQQDCRRADPNCTFAGSAGIGAQAVNWIDPGNRVVGDWDPDSKSGTVYPQSRKSSINESIDALKARLAQLKADYADLPKNPGSQIGYDALDDIRDEIKKIQVKIKEASMP